jgi:hypothetical protein
MIGRTRLPNPTIDYNYEWGNQLTRAIDQNLDRAFAGWPNYAEASGFYGSFYDTTDQTAAAVNTPYAMKLNTTVESNQISVLNNSQITFKNRGTYNIQFSAQFSQSSASDHFIWIWMRKNGTDIPNSTGKISIKGSKGDLVAAWNFVLSVLGGDYVEIMWAVEDTGIVLLHDAPTAFAPAVPSVIVTATSI